MSKPHVVVVADTYYPKVDGTLRFMEEFIRRASDTFHLSLVVPDLGEKQGHGVIYLPTYKNIAISGYPSVKLSWENLRSLKNAVREADVVFIQGPALISYLGMYYGRKYGKKTFFYLHVISWELFEKFFPSAFRRLLSFFIKRFSIFLYNRCDALFVPYQDLKEELEKNGITTTVQVVRLGVDIDRFSPSPNKKKSKADLELDPRQLVVGYVGRISREKNVEVLLRAFKKLRPQHKYHLLMVGDGPPELTAEFRELKNCTVTGFVSNVPDYLQAMDIFVMPSLTETTSLATLEAMSSGLPVIATKVGFMKSYIVKGHNGLFFPKNSPAVLAMKITKVLKDQALKEQLARNARRTIAYSFSWERSINRIKQLILQDYYK